jgi:hypothetical protein
MHPLLAGISWEPNIHGALIVLIAIVVLPGTVYMVLATNTGARLGLLLALTGLFGWMSIMGITWWVYGIGLKGPVPHWKAKEVVVGSMANARTPVAANFPRGWKQLALQDPQTTEALAAADPILVPPAGQPGRKFFDAGGYITVGAFETGGKRYGPFHVLNFRPFNLWHEPHFFVLQVQQSFKPAALPGQAAASPRATPDAPVVSLILLRDLGHLRRESALVALSSLALFSVCASTLHRRDKEAMRLRAEVTT